MNTVPVEILGLERSFGRRPVLRGVDLDVFQGEIIGLVGPNGSGKTTLLKTVGGFLRPHGGEVRVFGCAPFEEQSQVMQNTRFAYSPPALFESLTASEHLRHLCTIRTKGMARVTGNDMRRALETVGLADRAHDRVATFSTGMRQRLVIALALLPLPDLLVLDEPTDGLDPLAVLDLREILAELRSVYGISILLSSHLLVEIEELVDRMLVLHEGRSLFYGRPGELIGRDTRLRLEVSDAVQAKALFVEHEVPVLAMEGSMLDVPMGALTLDDAAALLANGNVTLASFAPHAPRLEQALLERLRAEIQSKPLASIHTLEPEGTAE